MRRNENTSVPKLNDDNGSSFDNEVEILAGFEQEDDELFDRAPDPEDSEGKIIVTLDSMRAFLNVTMPKNGGKPLSDERIRGLIAEANIKHGLRELTLAHLSANPLYNRDVLIAEGTPPRKGKDGTLIYQVRLSKDAMPTERSDGSVDYKNLGIIENVEKDQILCLKVPPDPGEPGTNIYGDPVPALPGKDIALPMGKNTYISENQLELRATTSGQCDFVERRLNVFETFFVKGDVSFATGNISFIGNVSISGNVLTGFSVQAGGNIDVDGCVEGAKLLAGGNVIIRNGFHGMNKGEIIAGGSVRCKYIQAGRVQAGSFVEANVILSANVQSADSVKLLGSRSTILGGRVIAKNLIESMYIGGRNNPVPTIVEVGCDPSLVTRAQEIQKLKATNTKSLADVDRILQLLMQLKEQNRLTQEKQEMLVRTVHTRRNTAELLVALEQEAEDIRLKLASEGYGTIIVGGCIFPGVRIVIGPEQQIVSSPINSVMMVRNDEGLSSHNVR